MEIARERDTDGVHMAFGKNLKPWVRMEGLKGGWVKIAVSHIFTLRPPIRRLIQASTPTMINRIVAIALARP